MHTSISPVSETMHTCRPTQNTFTIMPCISVRVGYLNALKLTHNVSTIYFIGPEGMSTSVHVIILLQVHEN